jgi:hypothetical protein
MMLAVDLADPARRRPARRRLYCARCGCYRLLQKLLHRGRSIPVASIERDNVSAVPLDHLDKIVPRGRTAHQTPVGFFVAGIERNQFQCHSLKPQRIITVLNCTQCPHEAFNCRLAQSGTG